MLAQILTPRQIQAVHETSIRILEKIGVLLPHEDMLSRLEGAGAKVDHASHRAWIPEHLVMACLATAGKQFDNSASRRIGEGREGIHGRYHTPFA